MKSIYKYLIPFENDVFIMVPAGSRFLSLEMVRDMPVVYFVVDPKEKKMEKYSFKVYGTGWNISNEDWKDLCDNWWDIGTIQMMEGILVWHVWMSEPEKCDEAI